MRTRERVAPAGWTEAAAAEDEELTIASCRGCSDGDELELKSKRGGWAEDEEAREDDAADETGAGGRGRAERASMKVMEERSMFCGGRRRKAERETR